MRGLSNSATQAALIDGKGGGVMRGGHSTHLLRDDLSHLKARRDVELKTTTSFLLELHATLHLTSL